MQKFFRIFLDIVLWRRGPQDLPSSTLLVGITLLVYVAISAIQLAIAGERGSALWIFLIIDPLALMGWTWAVLALFGKRERYLQTVAAVLGCSAVLSLVLALPVQVLARSTGGLSATAFAPLFLLLIAAFVAVSGRIIRIATESSMFNGVAVMLIYVLVMDWIANAVHNSGT